jgi:hypothetical protein
MEAYGEEGRRMRDGNLEGRTYRESRRDTFLGCHRAVQFAEYSSKSGEEPMGACEVAARLIPSSCSLMRFAELDECQAGNCRLGKRAISFVIAQPTFTSLKVLKTSCKTRSSHARLS